MIFDLGRRHAPKKRFPNCGIDSQPTAQDDVERFKRFTLGATSGSSLKPNITRPMLPTGVRASVEIEFQTGDFISKLSLQALEYRGELGLGGRYRVVAVRITDTSDLRSVEAIGGERKPNLADPSDYFLQTVARDARQDEVLPSRQAKITTVFGH